MSLNIFYFTGMIAGASPNLNFTEQINDFGEYSFGQVPDGCIFTWSAPPFGDLNIKNMQIATSPAICYSDVSGNPLAGNYQFIYLAGNVLKITSGRVTNNYGARYPFEADGLFLTLVFYQDA